MFMMIKQRHFFLCGEGCGWGRFLGARQRALESHIHPLPKIPQSSSSLFLGHAVECTVALEWLEKMSFLLSCFPDWDSPTFGCLAMVQQGQCCCGEELAASFLLHSLDVALQNSAGH